MTKCDLKYINKSIIDHNKFVIHHLQLIIYFLVLSLINVIERYKFNGKHKYGNLHLAGDLIQCNKTIKIVLIFNYTYLIALRLNRNSVVVLLFNHVKFN